MIPIGKSELKSLRYPPQHFSDCYLVSSICALARSRGGQKVLSENIAHHDNGFRIRFNKVNGSQQDYFISSEVLNAHPKGAYYETVSSRFKDPDLDRERVEAISNSSLKDRAKLLEEYYRDLMEKLKPNPLISAVEIAMGKLLKEHPEKKPLISRLITSPHEQRFEYNYPSNFMEMFTGETPFRLNERSLKPNLRLDKDKAVEIFEKIDKSDDFSVVAGTGIFTDKKLVPIHCYTVEGVNTENQYVQIFDCRRQQTFTLPFDKAIKALKYLTGYLRD